MKILALKFKYLGDVAVMVPALRALRARFPGAELHVLVAADAAPLLAHLPWLDKIWALPRKRGAAQLGRVWPLLRALRREKFDRSVDFVGNDRGAWLSFAIGARQRLGMRPSDKGFPGRRFLYHTAWSEPPHDRHESLRDLALLEAWGVPAPENVGLEITADPALRPRAAALLPEGAVLCHLSTSQPKKEWPLERWRALAALAKERGRRLVFSAGISAREQGDLARLKELAPGIEALPPVPDLALFLAVLERAAAFVGGDTGPLHFAAGVGTPTLALYGPTSVLQWAPLGSRHAVLTGGACGCSGHAHVCTSPAPCIDQITPEQAMSGIERLLASSPQSPA